MGNTRSASDKILYTAREHLREQLATPIGMILTDISDFKAALADVPFIISVGDVVTLDILGTGHIPDISIVDYKTRRMPMAEVRERFSHYPQEEVSVNNPPGVITKGLWDAVSDGVKRPRKLRIVVDGEEDLASLVCIVLAPEGASVVYGIPSRGASFHRVDSDLKRLVNEMLGKMKA